MNTTSAGHTAGDLLAAAPRFDRAITEYLLHEPPMHPLQVLAAHGWTPDDMLALDATWGGICVQTAVPAQVREVLTSAGRITAGGFIPAQARAWVNRLWTVRGSGVMRSPLGEAALDWLITTGHDSHPHEEGDFAVAYRDAAFGDLDAALVVADLDGKMLMPEQVGEIVGAYVAACGGDRGLALAAVKAGFGISEIAGQVAAGTADRDTLAIMIALRGPVGD